MNVEDIRSPYIVVDTESDASMFLEELLVYLTGQYHEGRDLDPMMVAGYSPDIAGRDWWARNVARLPTPVSRMLAATTYPTPGWFENGVDQVFRDTPENHGLARASALRHPWLRDPAEVAEARERLANGFKTDRDGFGKAECQIKVEDFEKAKATLAELRSPSKMSVAIFVKAKPPGEVLDEMFERAATFATEVYPELIRRKALTHKGLQLQLSGNEPQPLTITGFRFVDIDKHEESLDSTSEPSPR